MAIDRFGMATRAAILQRGLTIVEFMIAIALGLIIVAAVLTIFANSSRSRNELQKTSQQKENGRYAAQLLSNNLALAGYLGEFDPTLLLTPTALPGTDDLCTADLDKLKAALPLHVQGVNDATSSTPMPCLSDVKANTDVLVIRRAADCVAGAGDCASFQAGQPHIQTSLCSTDTGEKYVLDTSSGSFIKTKINCATPSDIRRYLVQIYFIANNNSSGDGIPTLKRWELGSNPAIVPLVDGIEEIQLDYGVDTNNDGAPDSWIQAPGDATTWRNVMAVRVNLLARNSEPSPGHRDSRIYPGFNRNGAGESVAFNDGYKRHVYTTTTSLTNAVWRRQ